MSDTRQKTQGAPWLYANSDGDLVGLKDPDGSELFLPAGVNENQKFAKLSFDTAAPGTVSAPGEVAWNAAEGTLEVVMNGGQAVQQIGQEMYYRVKNKTGSLIPNGTVVMATGAVGNSGHIKIAPAVGDGSVPAYYIMGITTYDIDNGDDGLVTEFGLVRGVQTNGADVSEVWVDGTILWVHPTLAGKMTKNEPVSPAIKVPVAIVLKANPRNGSLFVRPTINTRLVDLNDVKITNPQDGQVLKYQASTGLWINAAP